MCLMSFLCFWNQCDRAMLRATMIVALVVSGAGISPVSAADRRPRLVAPASESTLHVAVALPAGIKLKPNRAWQLVEAHNSQVRIPAQVVPAIAADGSAAGGPGRLLASIPPRPGAEGLRRFRLEQATMRPESAREGFRFDHVSDKSLKLSDGDAPVLVYNHGVITNRRVPQDDHRRSRACYIHPLWGLRGEVLTDDFPEDHYHHHGIFWTWPHVGVEGEHYDLWAGPKIKDRFVRWICRRTWPVAAVLAVENGWFVGERKVMIERVWLSTFRASGATRSLDLEFTWIPVEEPITLRGAAGKSYGGLTARFAPRSRQDTVITVPGGRTTEDLKMARLEWADFTSKLGDADSPSGAAIFVSPEHPDYPPTWLTRHYGALCVGWPGVEPRTFEPGKPIRLDYRIWIHRSAVELGQLNRAYRAYVAATKAKWQ